MSINSKMRRARQTAARRRAKAKINSAIDHAMRYGVGDAHIGTLMHYHMQHGPVDPTNQQITTYARLAGLDEVFVLHGGDLIHHTKRK